MEAGQAPFAVAFCAGVAMLGWHLWVYSQFLRGKRVSMPDHVLELFRGDPVADAALESTPEE